MFGECLFVEGYGDHRELPERTHPFPNRRASELRLYAVIGTPAARRRRDETGKSVWIDCALLDSQVGVLGNQAPNYLVSGDAPSRLGNAHPNVVPYEVFPASDGHVIIAVGNDGQFRRLCKALDLANLGDARSEEHTSELQSLMRNSYAGYCLQK